MDVKTAGVLVGGVGAVVGLSYVCTAMGRGKSLAETSNDLKKLIPAILSEREGVLDSTSLVDARVRARLRKQGERDIAPLMEVIRYNVEKKDYAEVSNLVDELGKKLDAMRIPTTITLI